MKNFCLLLFCFCNLGSFSQTTPIEIKFDPENMETCDLGLSDFIESIEYIPLETKDECLIGQGMLFDYDETHIVVKYNESESAYLFDRKGRFLRTIGTKGGGPEEFIDIHNVFLGSDNNSVIIAGLGKALCFNKQGKYLYTTPLPFDDRGTVAYFREFLLRTAESYILKDSSYNVYTLYNQKGYLVKEAIPSIPIFLQEKNSWRISYKCKSITPVYTYQNMPHVREYLNDTVFVINGLNQFKPKYIFNLGKYKITPEIQGDIEHFQDRIRSKFVIVDIIEMSDNLLIQYFHDWNIYSCYYNKKKHKLYKFDSSGYPNDYDGGIDFTSSTMNGQKNQFTQTAFYANDFLSFLEDKKHGSREIKGDKSAVKAFNKLKAKVDPEDNPIIMIIKLKE